MSSSIHQIRLDSSTVIELSPSPDGTLDTTSSVKFVSNDTAQSSATSYTSVDTIAATETNSSIFAKFTSMIRNIRYLYNRNGTTDISSIGSTITAAISALQSSKAATSHSHTVSDLPVTTSQMNSTSYIPTASLLYSMNETLTSLNSLKTSYGTTELTPGTSALTTGKIHCVYED